MIDIQRLKDVGSFLTTAQTTFVPQIAGIYSAFLAAKLDSAVSAQFTVAIIESVLQIPSPVEAPSSGGSNP